jgi:hypothetical protein
MGAFFGSVQIKTADRKQVLAAARDVGQELGNRCYVGPVLNGWVGVYPSENGQDHRVGEALAKRLETTVWHVLVHDDDVLAYWLWDAGQLADSYWSLPGYFGEENRAEEEEMAGSPDVLSRLVGGQAAALRKLLARDSAYPFASSQLEELQERTRIRNLTTAYEYLKEGETEGVQGWRQFREVPAQRVKADAEQKRRTRGRVATERKKLEKTGLLLCFEEREDGFAYACATSGEFVLAWPDHRRGTVSFATYHEPYDKPQPLALDTPAHITGVEGAASGKRVAMAAGSRVRVWDLASGTWNLLADIPETDLAIAVAISADGKLVAHSSRREIVVTEVATGRRVASCPNVSCRRMKFHPSGDWIACAGGSCGLVGVGEDPHWRALSIGSESNSAASLGAILLHEMPEIAVENFVEQARATYAAVMEQIREFGQRSNEAAIQPGQSPLPARGSDEIMGIGFSRDGRWLWCGTRLGARVYDWSLVLRSGRGKLPRPQWSFDLPPTTPLDVIRYVFAIAEEVDAPAVVFGDHAGRLYRLDLSTGSTRELARLPGESAILGLTMSADGQALGIATQSIPSSVRRDSEERWGWQIWSYPRLRGPFLSAGSP